MPLAFTSAGGYSGGFGGQGDGAGALRAECEVQEECSKEQLVELMEQLKGRCSIAAAEPAGGADSAEEREGRLGRRRAAVQTLALHAERDAELRGAIVGAGLLGEVAGMLEVGLVGGPWVGLVLVLCLNAAGMSWLASQAQLRGVIMGRGHA